MDLSCRLQQQTGLGPRIWICPERSKVARLGRGMKRNTMCQINLVLLCQLRQGLGNHVSIRNGWRKGPESESGTLSS